jgi:GTPase SAR1 family protein
MELETQPAKVSYFFGKGYRDLVATIKGAWQRNFDSIKAQWNIAQNSGIFSMGGAIHTVAAISIIGFGSIITFWTSLIHAAVLVTFFCLVYLGFSIVWLVDRIYIYTNKIKNACPNSACQASFLIPSYECPQCHTLHTKLVPGKYGILKRTCNCNNQLPTTFLNGRGELKAYCPECNTGLSGNTGSKQYAIPIIGGPSVGKTCYLNMAIDRLMGSIAPSKGWDLKFMSEHDANDHKSAMASLKKGIRLMQTDADALTAYQMMLILPGEKIGRRLYIYDIAGEMFANSGYVMKNKAYSYADGFIFLIDPLSIGRYAMEVVDKIQIDRYGVSTKDFDEILNVMLINLEKMFNLKPNDILQRNLAVVINKCDVPGLEEMIGDTAAQKYLSQHPECDNFNDARNKVCQEFLERYESGNFVRTANSKFKQVQYFTCSALGHNREGVPFESKNVEAPLLWILNKVDHRI